MRFVLVAAVFVFTQAYVPALCSGMMMFAIIWWADEAVRGLLWCRRQFFPVSTGHRRGHIVLAAPHRAQRHGVQVARYR